MVKDLVPDDPVTCRTTTPTVVVVAFAVVVVAFAVVVVAVAVVVVATAVAVVVVER
jgi:hypothetical protein